MGIEYNVIDLLKNPKDNYSMELLFLSIDLINDSLNPEKIIKLAKKENIAQRLGYLCELTAKAAEEKGFSERAKILYGISEQLHSNYSWEFLDTDLPDFAKKLYNSSKMPEINEKWKIRDIWSVEDIKEYIDLYLTKENV